MKGTIFKNMSYRFTDNEGTFELENAGAVPYLYFPLCNEAGIMSCITPSLGGDIKLDQNHFIMQPVSVEDLHNNKSARNFWLRFDDGQLRSASGASVWQKAEKDPTDGYPKLRAGLLWHQTENEIRYNDTCVRSVITGFVPTDPTTAEIMHVSLENTGRTEASFDPIAVIPMYGRSAANIRDHRHVTSLLHRISTEKYGVRVKPTLSFDERGHLKNDTEYFTLGCTGEGDSPEAFYPTVTDIIGEGGDFEYPLGLVNSRTTCDCTADKLSSGNTCNSMARDKKKNNWEDGCGIGQTYEGVEAAGGLRFPHRVLAPGEKADFIIFIGAKKANDSYNDAAEIIKRFGNTEKLKKAFEENRRFWIKKAASGLPEKIYSLKEVGGADSDTPAGTVEDASIRSDGFWLWVGVEPVLRRIFGCSFLPYHDYGKGGRGWRDLWQDCLALMLGDPLEVRELLINNFAGVRADGTNATIIGLKPGEFIADRNGIARVWMDHGVWPWITVQLYMELSCDTDFVKEEQYYFKDILCCRAKDTDLLSNEIHGKDLDTVGESAGNTTGDTGSESRDTDNTKDCTDRESGNFNILCDRTGREYRGSILEHILLMHITAACDVGEHGHMLLRGADWNDALDMAPERGESVAFTMAYAGNLKEISVFLAGKSDKYYILNELNNMIDELAEASGQQHTISSLYQKKREILDKYCDLVRHDVSGEKTEISADRLSEKLDLIAASIMEQVRNNEYMTDGELGWFNGYYDNDGLPVESLKDQRLMLTSAVFAIMSGTATDEQTGALIRTADRYLCSPKNGGYRLNTRFEDEERYARKLGRMFG
ncbi:MAG: hypothetical protein J6Y89_08550, partial [Lachnospiraceae bacterium]|nr:hypothetical protein [Lachnospiraceae bacterium]